MKFLLQFMNPLFFPCTEPQVPLGITIAIIHSSYNVALPNCTGEKTMNAGRRVFVPIVIILFPPLHSASLIGRIYV